LGANGKKTALVLGGGAARGFAHLGVLEVFEENGIAFDMIVGTSMGALVGGVYASGVPLAEVERAMLEVPWKRMVSYFRPRFGGGGLMDAREIVKGLATVMGDAQIEDFRVPFAAVAADIRSGERVVFTRGSAITAIRASISVPGTFSPVMDGGRAIVDGGIVEPVPVPTARDLGAELVVAVNVLDHPAKRSLNGRLTPRGENEREAPSRLQAAAGGEWHDKVLAFAQKVSERRRQRRLDKGRGPWLGSILWNSLRIMQYSLSELQTREANVVIEPDLGDILPSEFYRGRECVAAGRRAAADAVPAIRAMLAGGGGT
jgi:NTE family protein